MTSARRARPVRVYDTGPRPRRGRGFVISQGTQEEGAIRRSRNTDDHHARPRGRYRASADHAPVGVCNGCRFVHRRVVSRPGFRREFFQRLAPSVVRGVSGDRVLDPCAGLPGRAEESDPDRVLTPLILWSLYIAAVHWEWGLARFTALLGRPRVVDGGGRSGVESARRAGRCGAPGGDRGRQWMTVG